MKKLLSILLAMLTAFSVVTFTVNAEETDTPAEGGTVITPEAPVECTHVWTTKIVIDATCTEKGVRTNTCNLCNEENSEYFGPYAHQYGEPVVVAPTCSGEGYTAKICTVCEHIEGKTDIIPALEHTYGEWTETLAPTCTEKGSRERICSACNKIETEEIPALGHDYKITVIEPDYENGGYTLNECTRCGDTKKTDETEKLKGKVVSLELGDKITLNYEDTVDVDLSGLVIGGEVNYTVAYKITHRLAEENVIELVDEKEGTIKAVGMGNATLTVAVTDEYGNTVEDSVTVQVNFSLLDWFKLIGSILLAAIEIVLGGLDFSSLGQLFK